MREKLRAFTVKVEDSLADRIELNAAVFSSSSAFLRLMARVFFRMVDDGRIKLQADWLQENLRSNSGNQRNRVASAARSEVADPSKATRLPQPTSTSRQTAAKAVMVEAWTYPHFLPTLSKNMSLGIITL